MWQCHGAETVLICREGRVASRRGFVVRSDEQVIGAFSAADSFLADVGQPALGEQIGHLSDRPQAEPVGGDWERGHGVGIAKPDDRSPGWPDYPCQLPER